MRIHASKHFQQAHSFASRFSVSILCALICLTSFHAAAQTKVTTWHYNNGLTGANTTEKILTASNVKVSTFGKLFTQPVDGFIVGQPLYLPGVTIPNKGLHNVVYVATMNDTVYAFDADASTAPALWKASLLSHSPAGATAVPVSVKGCAPTTKFTQVGVVSTPVIDAAAGYLYLVAETYENACSSSPACLRGEQ
jgi:hypothetical protein